MADKGSRVTRAHNYNVRDGRTRLSRSSLESFATATTAAQQSGTSPSSQQQAGQFRFFPMLSPEVQEKIWQEVERGIGPRIVTFSDDPSNVPALFQACGASRDFLLKTHERLEEEGDEYNRGFVVLVDFDNDLVLLERHDHRFTGLYRLSPFREGVRRFGCWLRKVKRLAINFEQADIEDHVHDRCDEFWIWLETACPILEEFTIVCDSRVTCDRGTFGTDIPQEISQLWHLGNFKLSFEGAQNKGILSGVKFKIMTRA